MANYMKKKTPTKADELRAHNRKSYENGFADGMAEMEGSQAHAIRDLQTQLERSKAQAAKLENMRRGALDALIGAVG